jgi:uncharacterized Zn finger protein (UPF0148 family)
MNKTINYLMDINNNFFPFIFIFYSCEGCKNKLFNKKSDAECPVCRKKLLKGEFKEKSSDELEFETDLRFRNKVLKL